MFPDFVADLMNESLAMQRYFIITLTLFKRFEYVRDKMKRTTIIVMMRVTNIYLRQIERVTWPK